MSLYVLSFLKNFLFWSYIKKTEIMISDNLHQIQNDFHEIVLFDVFYDIMFNVLYNIKIFLELDSLK